jgi:hypothetical protein
VELTVNFLCVFGYLMVLHTRWRKSRELPGAISGNRRAITVISQQLSSNCGEGSFFGVLAIKELAMKLRRHMVMAIVAGALVGCLLQAGPAHATNSVWVTGGSGTCGQGGGYEVNSSGTYTADTWPLGRWSGHTAAIQAWCVTVQNDGTPWPDGGPYWVNATLNGVDGVLATNTMPAVLKPTPPSPYFIGWYVWYKLGYYENGNFIVVCSSPEYCIHYTGSCFVAGTPILTPEGSKAIEQLHTGDRVLSSPEKVGDGQIGARRIKEVTRGRAKLVGITVSGHLIQASREHPFFVRGESWTPASSLTAGDFLRTHDGRWVEIEAVAEGPESWVYNVRVEENPTYFVGSRDWGFSLWVRDVCGIPKQQRDVPSFVATEAARK